MVQVVLTLNALDYSLQGGHPSLLLLKVGGHQVEIPGNQRFTRFKPTHTGHTQAELQKADLCVCKALVSLYKLE